MNSKLSMSVKECAHPVSLDVDPDAHVDAVKLDNHVAACVAEVLQALKSQTTTLSDFQRSFLAALLHAMKWTHASVRELLRHETNKPMSIDAMPLVRTQLESLYAVCLLVEDPSTLDAYLKDSWKKLYKRYLLQRAECHNLTRFKDYLEKRALPSLQAMSHMLGVTPAEIATIDHDELGLSPPAGFVREEIHQFPSPRAVIRRIRNANRKKMLVRLYPEYQFLCSFVHVSPHPGMFKLALDDRLPMGKVFTSQQLENMFQGEIAGPALYIDLISVVQSCTEVATLYRAQIDLLRHIENAWRTLGESSLLGRAIWEIRGREALGVIE